MRGEGPLSSPRRNTSTLAETDTLQFVLSGLSNMAQYSSFESLGKKACTSQRQLRNIQFATL